MAAHEIRIDLSRTLADEPGTGHNRWHPDIPPILTIEPGDEVLMEARDGGDALISRNSTLDDLLSLDLNLVHPLTGPVYIKDAEPGDLLVVDVLDVIPGDYGFTLALPGFGYLRDVFDEPFCAKWEQAAGGAVCNEIPGVKIPGAPFMGGLCCKLGEGAMRDQGASCSPYNSALARRSCSNATASVRAHGPRSKARSTIRASPTMPPWRANIPAWPLRSARITSKPLIVA